MADDKKGRWGALKSIFGTRTLLTEDVKLEKMLNLQKVDDGVIIKVKVRPGVAKNEIVGVQEDTLKIKISAPAVKGKANKALIDFLAKELGVKRSEVQIISGHTSRIEKTKVLGQGTRTKETIQDLPVISTRYDQRV